MPGFKARSPLAMRIANVDRQKFNEAVSAGHYGCAPETNRGSSRIFSEDDLVGLYVFGRLLDIGMGTRAAGSFACKFKEKTESHPEEASIVFVKGMSGAAHFFLGSEYNPKAAEEGKTYLGSSPVSFSINFHLGNIRSFIRRELEDEGKILGRDDDE
jgi:hypothetical protein